MTSHSFSFLRATKTILAPILLSKIAAPGMTATDMYANYLNKNGEVSDANQKLLRRQYLGIANTTDIANAIAYLISPAARFITGTSLLVDSCLIQISIIPPLHPCFFRKLCNYLRVFLCFHIRQCSPCIWNSRKDLYKYGCSGNDSHGYVYKLFE